MLIALINESAAANP